MKKLSYIWIVLLVVSLWGCRDDPTTPDIEEASAQKQFVWNAMNFWYYWQGDVQELDDNYFSDDAAFHEYLNSFSDAEAVFNALLHPEDDFSFFIENYEEFQQRQQGISQSFGYEFGLVRESENSNNIFGYVQYVLPDSPAEDAGLVRGDIFTSVDGTRLTVNNYRDLLLNTTSYELTLGEIVNGEITETDETISMQAVNITEDPIFVSTVIDTNATKIGYLMYNAFQLNSHSDLNNKFRQFKAEGIDELIIDLRYNGGGAGITSQLLGSLISGLDSSNVFSIYEYNSKRSNLNNPVHYIEEVPIYNEDRERVRTESMNALSMPQIYVLTGFGTASASEMVINSLNPYIDVVIVGRKTVGKDEGSYTLYDTPSPPYFNEDAANPNHNNAIQPIALKLVNSEGQDYPNGFLPEGYDPNVPGGCPDDDNDNCVNEIAFLEDGLPPLGDPDDPLLARALALITGQPAKIRAGELVSVGQPFKDSKDLQAYEKGLYILPEAVKVPNFIGEH